MKLLNAIIVFLCLQVFVVRHANASGSSSKNLGLDLGIGFFSNYGLLGGGARYFVSESQDIHFNAGIDVSGLLKGFGTRRYFHSSKDTCFFVFNCKSKYFIGGTLLRSENSTVTVDGDGARGVYKQSEGYVGNFSVGTYEIFGDLLTIGTELGYRLWMKRPEISYQSGAFLQKHKNDLEKYGENSLNIALTLGWLF